MEQLSLNIGEKSEVKVIASSAYQFRVELVKKVGKNKLEYIKSEEMDSELVNVIDLKIDGKIYLKQTVYLLMI